MAQNGPENQHDDKSRSEAGSSGPTQSRPHSSAPEPPPSWRPPETSDSPDKRTSVRFSDSSDSGPSHRSPYFPQGPQNGDDLLVRARNYLTISQICAIVSIFIGGVLLSGVALALALLGTRALRAHVQAHGSSSRRELLVALQRASTASVAVSVMALVFNFISVIFLYPIVMDAIQTGDFGTLFGGGSTSGTPSGTGSSTWG